MKKTFYNIGARCTFSSQEYVCKNDPRQSTHCDWALATVMYILTGGYRRAGKKVR